MSVHEVSIRLAAPRDAQAIALMSRDLVETGLGWKYDAARMLQAIRAPDTLAPLACAGGRIAGFALMEFGEERAHLVLLAVRPAERRLGIGRRLVEWLVESARVAGIASLHLELRAANEAARGFYRALGFDETIVVPGYYRGREAALRMIRVLRATGPVPYTWRPSSTI
ncbi:MAG TPA: GNAT family N-acetyltransferase [Burkholderiales bacterium]|nr:GNAT family N-acetyltransferase [Burkholderiales bacterium]